MQIQLNPYSMKDVKNEIYYTFKDSFCKNK